MPACAGYLTARICLSGEGRADNAPAPPKQPLAVGFQFFASLALPLLVALQRPAAPADRLKAEHRKAKRRRKSYDAAADGHTCQLRPNSLAWADVARSVTGLPVVVAGPFVKCV
jgi:hypothetical protein